MEVLYRMVVNLDALNYCRVLVFKSSFRSRLAKILWLAAIAQKMTPGPCSTQLNYFIAALRTLNGSRMRPRWH